MKLSDVAKKIMEADDDKYVSIGYGRYKLKGKEDDDDADVFTKTDSGQYVKSADQKSDDDDKGGEEEPKSKGFSPDDFERDFDDSEPEDKPFGGDTGKDADFGSDDVDGPKPDEDTDASKVMNATINGEKVADIVDNPDHPLWDKAIDYVTQFAAAGDEEDLIKGKGEKEESITINGQKYRPIKESKQHIFKEIYDRTFRSLK